jgi:hypothetical protein
VVTNRFQTAQAIIGKSKAVKKNKQPQSEPPGPEKSQGLMNLLRLIFLVAVLAGAWFLLDWLINGK